LYFSSPFQFNTNNGSSVLCSQCVRSVRSSDSKVYHGKHKNRNNIKLDVSDENYLLITLLLLLLLLLLFQGNSNDNVLITWLTLEHIRHQLLRAWLTSEHTDITCW